MFVLEDARRPIKCYGTRFSWQLPVVAFASHPVRDVLNCRGIAVAAQHCSSTRSGTATLTNHMVEMDGCVAGISHKSAYSSLQLMLCSV